MLVRLSPWLPVALAMMGCRPSTVEAPAQPRTRRLELSREVTVTPSWEQAANVRLWTVGLERSQIEALRPQPGLPLFVRMSQGGLEVVACPDPPPIEWSFEPELPVAQRYVWSGVELDANIRVGARLHGRDQVEVGVIPIGSYWITPDHKATLRRQACEAATHVVVGVRVGQAKWLAENLHCTVWPDASSPPPGCDVPWMVELLARDPLARPGPICPGGTAWTGSDCKSAAAPDEYVGPFCDASTYNLPVCALGWRINDWERHVMIALPERLEPEDIEPVMAAIAPELAACVPVTDAWSIVVVVEGSSGRIVELRVPARFTEPTTECMLEFLRPLAFPSFAAERQPIHWPLLGGAPSDWREDC